MTPPRSWTGGCSDDYQRAPPGGRVRAVVRVRLRTHRYSLPRRSNLLGQIRLPGPVASGNHPVRLWGSYAPYWGDGLQAPSEQSTLGVRPPRQRRDISGGDILDLPVHLTADEAVRLAVTLVDAANRFCRSPSDREEPHNDIQRLSYGSARHPPLFGGGSNSFGASRQRLAASSTSSPPI